MEEAETTETEEEQTSLTQPPATEEEPEKASLTGSAWMQSKEVLLDLSWLWITLLIITITGIAAYWLKKKST